MQARAQIRVTAAGIAGTHGAGPGDYPPRPLEAQFATDGLHGQSATRPSAGTPAGNINARLAYIEAEPGLVQVAGEGPFTGKVWKVSRDQELFLDCSGGEGGRGGRGEDGQQGGKGIRGRDASKYREAEHGGRGGRGGDAGHGTNGADGGDAGNVLLTVGEDELDLLIAVTWDTSGGRGGPSGTHGMPGDGGIGGDGGNGCTWTERHGNTTTTYTKPSGMPGHVGIPGNQPAVYLTGGNSGRNGSTQIRVLRKDNTEATYPGCYKLEVVSFDVLDENEDGVNEPGEHLLVRNIKVINKGSMPSPNSATPISILIQGTQWLEPIESEPVIVPFSILPGDTVEVPGTTRALIRNETSPRAPGVPLRIQDQVTLIATFFKRLVRSIPAFSGSQTYNIGYPLELTPPKCLDCVQKGDRVRFSWVLRNVSRKTYGLPENGAGRYAATRFSDPERIFELPYKDTTDPNAPHEATDAVEEIEPGQEVHIDQDFIVSDTAYEYSDGKLHIELLFADPHAKQPDGASVVRNIMIYEINMQIAGVYTYDPLSRYLLVVNAKTPNYAIHQMIGFIRKELRLGLDIFNLSISGNYIDAADRPVLQSYEGKSILVYGNTFDYFGKGLRNPWDLMDSWELCSLAKAGTSFSFLGVSNVNDLQAWASNITFSVVTTSKETASAGLLDSLVNGIQGEDQTKWTSEIPLRQIRGQDSFISKLGECTCFSATTSDKIAQKASKKLTKSLPLRRFLAVPDASSTDAKERNIFIIEGLPKSAFVMASMVTPPQNTAFVLADHHKYAILAALPFANLAKIFWNAWGASTPDAAGAPWFPHTTLYAGTGWEETQSLDWNGAMLEQKILHMIILAIETRIGTEINWFLGGDAPSKDSLLQLPNLTTFLNMPQGSGQLATVPEHDTLVMALGTILGSLIRIGFGQWFNTLWSSKKKLKIQVSKDINEALTRVCAPATAASIHKAVQAQAKLVKKEIKAAGKERNLSLLVFQRLVKLTQINTGFMDLVAVNPESTSVTLQGLEQMRLQHGGRAGVRQQFESHAKDVIQVHVNPDVEDE